MTKSCIHELSSERVVCYIPADVRYIEYKRGIVTGVLLSVLTIIVVFDICRKIIDRK